MIITQPTVEPITLTALKVQLGISDTNSDTVLTRRITEARKWAEIYTKRSIMPQTHELRLDAFPSDGMIELPFPQVVSIVSVKYIATDGALTTVDAADYTLDTVPLVPFVRPVYGESWPSPRVEASAVRVQYTTGYTVSSIAAAKTITGITKATPGVVTSAAHGYADGDLILLDIAGMTELDGLLYRVYAKTTDTFQLAKLSNDGGISTASFTTFTSGTATAVEVAVPEIIIEAMAVLCGHWTNFQSRLEGGQFITRVPAAVEQMLDTERVWGVI